MIRHARYSWHDDGVVLLIFDESGPLSLTNDVEWVIRRFAEVGIDVDTRLVIYRDSAGKWDGIATSGGRFRAFIVMGTSEMHEALAHAHVMRARGVWLPGR